MADFVTEVYKRAGHRLVNLSGGDSFKVPTALFRLYPLKPGEEIDVQAYARQLAAAEPRHALEQAVNMLERRDRSVQEVTKKLVDAGYSQQAAGRACARLLEGGYLDDERYASQAISRLGKKYGSIRLRRELRRAGIAEEIISRLLDAREPEEQLEAAISLAQKSLRGKTLEPAAAWRRAYGALARRGYPPNIVRAALAAALAEEPEDFIPESDA